jgi:hypothetical protein
MKARPIITSSAELNNPPTKGIIPKIIEPIMDTNRMSMISPNSDPNTLNALLMELVIPVSSITIITNMRITTGIKMMVMPIITPNIDAKKKVKNLLNT